MQGGDCSTRESYSWWKSYYYCYWVPDLFHYCCPSHAMDILLRSPRYWDSERTRIKPSGRGVAFLISCLFESQCQHCLAEWHRSSQFISLTLSSITYEMAIRYVKTEGNNLWTAWGQPSITLRSLPYNFWDWKQLYFFFLCHLSLMNA